MIYILETEKFFDIKSPNIANLQKILTFCVVLFSFFCQFSFFSFFLKPYFLKFFLQRLRISYFADKTNKLIINFNYNVETDHY